MSIQTQSDIHMNISEQFKHKILFYTTIVVPEHGWQSSGVVRYDPTGNHACPCYNRTPHGVLRLVGSLPVTGDDFPIP